MVRRGIPGGARSGLVVVVGLATLALLPGTGKTAVAQENADCIACHGEEGLTGERKGRTVSLYVSEKAFAGSIHAGLACANCHVDLAGKKLPHDTPLKKPDCSSCHEAEDKQRAASLHGKAMKRGDEIAPTCAACHGVHDIRANYSESMCAPRLCPARRAIGGPDHQHRTSSRGMRGG